MARAPFGSEYEPAVWTGKRLLVVDTDTGRTATYDARRDRWRERSTAPRATEAFVPWSWTGAELLIFDVVSDGGAIGGLAYEPGRDRWRELAQLPLATPRSDHLLMDALWTGTHVVVIDALGLLVAYDPTEDCWTELGRTQLPGHAWHLYDTGSTFLVEARDTARPIATMHLVELDPDGGAWSEPIRSPLGESASPDGGFWSDGSLVFLSWIDTTEGTGAHSARFDPRSMTWEPFEHGCEADSFGTILIGRYLVAKDAGTAYDATSGTCVDMPEGPRLLGSTARWAWTGSELIVWSGIRALPEPPRRSGLVFRPARSTADD